MNNPSSLRPPLPVEARLPELSAALHENGCAVLQAPPGTGKTTRVPLGLLNESWLDGQRIVMLEPRRIAARAAAHHMAALLGEETGQTVGYRVRHDTRVGPETRVEVLTEGVLTRMLQQDPALDGIGLVIFDEFHERSLHADLGLALCIEARSLVRADLRVLVMSATLDSANVAALLGNAAVIHVDGRAHPVETHWRSKPISGGVEPVIVQAIQGALLEETGDILVFLPGFAEIRRVESALHELRTDAAVQLYALHGNLPLDVQSRAIAPCPPGQRKVVLATAIAETSLTIEGVRVVIDSGLMRVPRFSPRTGMTRLVTVPVTKASAEQRRGRAGRVGPGVCIRLWTEAQHATLIEHGSPEILEADLAPLALELAVWGSRADSLAWLDAPPPAALAQARELLRELGALDAEDRATDHGRAMTRLPVHPRLSHMLLRARALGHGPLACDIAALLSERDVLRGERATHDPDLRIRLDALMRPRPGSAIDAGGLQRVRVESEQLRRRLGLGKQRRAPGDESEAGILLALAYPDRIAQKRPAGRGRFLLRNGRGATTGDNHALAIEPYLAAAHVDDHDRESRILLAAPLDEQFVREQFSEQITQRESVVWDRAAGAVRARREERLEAIVLRDVSIADADPELVADAVLDAVRDEGLGLFDWSREALQLIQRLRFLRSLDASWPDLSDTALLHSLHEWLRPRLLGVRNRNDLRALDLSHILGARLTAEQRRRLGRLAPTHLTVPSGSRILIDYTDPSAPAVAVRLQEVFGLAQTPRLGGSVPLTFQLLSPARRPVQVTRDLESFWKTTYFEVRKDLRGRYPKHYWPDDPTTAQATRRPRPRPE